MPKRPATILVLLALLAFATSSQAQVERAPEPHGHAGTLAPLRADRAVAAEPLRAGQDPRRLHPRAVVEPLRRGTG